MVKNANNQKVDIPPMKYSVKELLDFKKSLGCFSCPVQKFTEEAWHENIIIQAQAPLFRPGSSTPGWIDARTQPPLKNGMAPHDGLGGFIRVEDQIAEAVQAVQFRKNQGRHAGFNGHPFQMTAESSTNMYYSMHEPRGRKINVSTGSATMRSFDQRPLIDLRHATPDFIPHGISGGYGTTLGLNEPAPQGFVPGGNLKSPAGTALLTPETETSNWSSEIMHASKPLSVGIPKGCHPVTIGNPKPPNRVENKNFTLPQDSTNIEEPAKVFSRKAAIGYIKDKGKQRESASAYKPVIQEQPSQNPTKHHLVENNNAEQLAWIECMKNRIASRMGIYAPRGPHTGPRP
ncbi:hypothetical protein EDC01DRAFT_725634 [Geopyxis carbonaria]|nr:hypothetical protein EDC01DRAFT_725634 [Geopyxis carbonaria]